MCDTGFLHSKEKVLKLALIKIYLNYLIITNVLQFYTLLQLTYLRFDSIGYCCGYIYKITCPRLGHIETKPLGIYKSIECSSIADVHCHITVTFHFDHHICGK